MGQRNQTVVTFFIFQGISDLPELQIPIFFLVLFIYLFSLGINSTIFLLVCLDHQLHTPMYFFLANLSILDMFSTTVTLHNILVDFVVGDNTISYGACLSEMYIYGCLICDELLILTAMSYDRYMAICNPLQYHLVMNRKVCILLATVCWLLGILEVIPYIVLLAGFTCYTSNVINHFFCDLVPLVKLSCSDTTAMEIVCLADGFVLISFTPFMLTFISYVFIISSIFRISSNIGRWKAFYTCSSHLTIVILLYSSLFFQYLRPTSLNTTRSNKFFSLYNTAVLPLLNPLIYSFKNKDVKSAMKRSAHLLKVCM
ncbi:olfactory receptor 5AR1-like [Lithobates pipiens]